MPHSPRQGSPAWTTRSRSSPDLRASEPQNEIVGRARCMAGQVNDPLRHHRQHQHLHGAFGNDRYGRFAERVARSLGTSRFLIGQTLDLIAWVVVNAKPAPPWLPMGRLPVHPPEPVSELPGGVRRTADSGGGEPSGRAGSRRRGGGCHAPPGGVRPTGGAATAEHRADAADPRPDRGDPRSCPARWQGHGKKPFTDGRSSRPSFLTGCPSRIRSAAPRHAGAGLAAPAPQLLDSELAAVGAPALCLNPPRV
jgi:hypothetical protein